MSDIYKITDSGDPGETDDLVPTPGTRNPVFIVPGLAGGKIGRGYVQSFPDRTRVPGTFLVLSSANPADLPFLRANRRKLDAERQLAAAAFLSSFGIGALLTRFGAGLFTPREVSETLPAYAALTQAHGFSPDPLNAPIFADFLEDHGVTDETLLNDLRTNPQRVLRSRTRLNRVGVAAATGTGLVGLGKVGVALLGAKANRAVGLQDEIIAQLERGEVPIYSVGLGARGRGGEEGQGGSEVGEGVAAVMPDMAHRDPPTRPPTIKLPRPTVAASGKVVRR